MAEASECDQRSALSLSMGLVDPFDPDNIDSHVNRWFGRIKQLGLINGWTEFESTTIVQARLTGLERCDLFWEEWQTKFQGASPRSANFVVLMEELVYRRKGANEPIAGVVCQGGQKRVAACLHDYTVASEGVVTQCEWVWVCYS